MALTGPVGGWAQLELSSLLTPVAEAWLQKAISSQNPAQGVPSPRLLHWADKASLCCSLF